MSIRLRDLIRNVRASKTAAEERAVVAKECAAIRTAFKDEDNVYRFRNVAKLLYIHMLGYPTHFGQMECLKLIASPKFPEKRIGYLGMMLLLDDEQEVLSLVENSLHKDLNHSNQYIVGLALCSLGNVCNDEMARNLLPAVQKLHKSPNPYIRKKSALVMTRFFRRLPDMIPDFFEKITLDTHGSHHGSLVTTTTLITELCKLDSSVIPHYRELTPVVVKLLKSLALSGYSPEYDVSGISDPHLHCRLLRLLGYLGANNPRASEDMNDILAQVATNTETSKNPGNAIVYECVQTILAIESESGLRVLAINILGRFLQNRDNNIRYVALNTLLRVVRQDPAAVARHKSIILDCLKDPDISIRRRALDLSYQLVTSQNIESMAKELLSFLTIADAEFKEALTTKLCSIFRRHAPSPRWHIDNVLEVLVLGGRHVTQQVASSCIALIAASPELHAYTTRRLYGALLNSIQFQGLVQVAIWSIGEFGDLLASGQGNEGDDIATPSPDQVVDMVAQVLKSGFSDERARFFCVTALMKLSSRFVSAPSPGLHDRIQTLITPFRQSMNLEMQQRSSEYMALFGSQFDSIRPALLEVMPVTIDPMAQEDEEEEEPSHPARSGRSTVQPSAQPPQQQQQQQVEQPQQPPAGADLLLGLLGDDTPVSQPAAGPVNPQPVQGGADFLLGLLDDVPSAPAVGGAAAAPPPMGPAVDMLPMGLNPNTQQQQQPANPTMVAYEKNGLTVRFELIKAPNQANHTKVNITFTNSLPQDISGLVFQAAVPKYCKMKIDEASSQVVAASNSGAVTQVLQIINGQYGQSPAKVLMRMTFSANGQQVQDQQAVDLPPGH